MLQGVNQLIICSIFMPHEVVRFYYREDFRNLIEGTVGCKILPMLGFSTTSVSYWILVLICLNRILLIWNPDLANSVFTWKNCILYTMLLWSIFVTYFMLPFTEYWGQMKYLKEIFTCSVTSERIDGKRKTINPISGNYVFRGHFCPLRIDHLHAFCLSRTKFMAA